MDYRKIDASQPSIMRRAECLRISIFARSIGIEESHGNSYIMLIKRVASAH